MTGERVEALEAHVADLIAVRNDLGESRGVHRPAVEQEEQLVALSRGGRPVDQEECADREVAAQLLADLAARRRQRALAWLDLPAGDVPVLLVGRVDDEHAVLVIAVENAGGNPRGGHRRQVVGWHAR